MPKKSSKPSKSLGAKKSLAAKAFKKSQSGTSLSSKSSKQNVSLNGDHPSTIFPRIKKEKHPLSEDCIFLLRAVQEKEPATVPPNSPRRGIIFGNQLITLPKKLPDIKDLDIPYVRVVGIRKSIELLAQYFGCSLYMTNLLHFWFLDVVTDCLWKCQDEFLLTDEYQRKVLLWVLYFFDVIRDPTKNFSRGQFFRLFGAAISVAEDYIGAGEGHLPEPQVLFDIKTLSEELVDLDTLSSASTDSSLSFDSDSGESYLVIPSDESAELPDFYKLPKQECKCNISISPSIESLSEKSIHSEEEENLHFNSSVDTEELIETFSLSDFYQSDHKVHSRFLDEIDRDDEPSLELLPIKEEKSDLKFEWENEGEKSSLMFEPRRRSLVTLNSQDVSTIVPSVKKSKTGSIKSKSKMSKKSASSHSSQASVKKMSSIEIKQETTLTEEETLKAWFDYNLWEQRAKDMADPSTGWVPPPLPECDDDCICAQMEYSPIDYDNEEYFLIKREWLQYLNQHKTIIDKSDQNKFINSCLLLIVKQFIFEYFYESFQYKLVKMTFQTPPNLILEKLNERWPVPKMCRDDEFKRPEPKKPKPQKAKRVKSPKRKKQKKTKSKSSKKSKSTKSSKSGKKSKSSKAKKPKPHKLTKEEKQEIERLKREELQRIQDEIAAEENKRFIFPLTLAADDTFFEGIFENYVRPSEDKKKKKKKDKKKDKKDKKKDKKKGKKKDKKKHKKK